MLRHSRQQKQQQPQHPREYLTMNVGGGSAGGGEQQPQKVAQAASHINSIQRQHRRSSIEATTNPSSKDLVPHPPPPIHDVAGSSEAVGGGGGQPRSGGCRIGLGHTGAVPNTIVQQGGGRHPLVDFCTLRRPASNNRPPPRSVQFADQQNVSNSTDVAFYYCFRDNPRTTWSASG